MSVTATGSTRERGGNLPAEITSFVGRRQEIAEVKRLLSESRLVTLTGPGGVGKTRLALRAGDQLQRSFPDGVWLVTLADLTDPGLLPETVAAALGVRNRSADDLMTTLTQVLKSRHLLLVMDNCEHMVDATARFIWTVLQSAPGVRVLATSRQSLGITEEQSCPVPPLSIPEQPKPSNGSPGQVPAQVLAQSEAVNLFTERAHAVHPSFSLTPENVPAVARICRRLDGIPLALELAAMRVRALSAEQILQRLDDRFRLLTLGKRVCPPRQQTLSALIDWSYDLCTDAERMLWERASVFSGGFDLEAAEKVCAGDGIGAGEMLDLIDALVDKSILSMDESGGGVRYRMLETIREYARDKLAASDRLTALRRRHRDYFRDLTESACRQWFGPDQVAWSARLEREHANLQAALEFCLTEPGEAQSALTIAANLSVFFESGYVSEGRRWFDRALAMAPEPTPARAAALLANASALELQGDIAAAKKVLAECRGLAEQLDDRATVAMADACLGWAVMCEDDPASAVTMLERSLAENVTPGAPEEIVTSKIILAMACRQTGDTDRAAALCEECLEISEAHGELWYRSWTLLYFSWVVWRQGDHRRAEALAKECLLINRELDDRVDIGYCLESLAWSAVSDQPERAARLFGAAQATMDALGAPLYSFVRGDHHRCLATARAALGDKRFDALFAAGAALSLEEAIAEAMEESEGGQAPAHRSGHGGATPLTRREREVAALVAEGLTNKEIAERLVISRRTAEGHVEHIMNKLGFTSRTQIAAYVSRPPGPA
ncbi:ATP-binding protein [Sphaerisporangium fuscum]|uniref:ATP-binding protein n=1 Tax=Sphaerisporangium fuscum TaxID=2835868 RepID=UPI001BDCAF3E|nr:LuxR C-terminal-related transcriptional regulator [Sphaerisporangium fuscum]